jgi:hypothetical protein
MGRPVDDQEIVFFGLAYRALDRPEFFDRDLGFQFRSVPADFPLGRRIETSASCYGLG